MSKKVVHFYRTEDEGPQSAAGSVILEDGQPMRFEGFSEYMVKSLRRGISPTGLTSDALTPEDGEKYLAALCIAYSGSRLRASRIMEE
jgi:hypothetical protein